MQELRTVVAGEAGIAAQHLPGLAPGRGQGLLERALRAQAVDVREAGRRSLLESAGKREIAMMVPVVFLVLPVTLLFALFPGFYGLSFMSS